MFCQRTPHNVPGQGLKTLTFDGTMSTTTSTTNAILTQKNLVLGNITNTLPIHHDCLVICNCPLDQPKLNAAKNCKIYGIPLNTIPLNLQEKVWREECVKIIDLSCRKERFKDVRAHCYCASLLCTPFIKHARSYPSPADLHGSVFKMSALF